MGKKSSLPLVKFLEPRERKKEMKERGKKKKKKKKFFIFVG
jgi:hypothetical protein